MFASLKLVTATLNHLKPVIRHNLTKTRRNVHKICDIIIIKFIFIYLFIYFLS